MLQWTQDAIPNLVVALSYGRLGFALAGALAVLANLINFIQLVSFYTFLPLDFPFNLDFVLRSFYTSTTGSLLPFQLPNILSNVSNVAWRRPSIYK